MRIRKTRAGEARGGIGPGTTMYFTDKHGKWEFVIEEVWIVDVLADESSEAAKEIQFKGTAHLIEGTNEEQDELRYGIKKGRENE